MQYVNDDMDDIFRRAAESYPLDTSGADWNKVLAGLQGQVTAKEPPKKGNQRRYLWLLMLLPLGLVCNYYYDRDKGTTGVNSGNSKQGHDFPSVETVARSTRNVSGENSANNIDMTGSGNETSIVSQPGISSTPQTKTLVFQKGGKNFNTTGDNGQSNITGKRNSKFNPGVKSSDWEYINLNQDQEIKSRRNMTYTGFISMNKMDLPVAVIQPSTKYQGLAIEQQKKTGLERNPKKFYVGLMGGIDVTTIEFQKASRNGFDYGMLAGYKIGRKWAVEAAAFMDKKYYYTEGKYFKNDGIYMPPNSWITDVDGYCRMWDISLGGSYLFSQRNKSGWFAAAGVSSYIMKKENYDYTYYYAGTGASAVHSKTYYNESKNLFSNINISMGYTHRLGKISDLRVEPYMKLPVQGVGVGNLSLYSAGVHIGITGRLF